MEPTKGRIIPFLTFHGNAEEAMGFYAATLPGANIEELTRFKKGERGDEGKVLAGILSVFGQRIQFWTCRPNTTARRLHGRRPFM